MPAKTMTEKTEAVLIWLTTKEYPSLNWTKDRFGNYIAIDAFGKKLRLKPKSLVIRAERQYEKSWLLFRSFPITATFKEFCK